MPFFIQYKGWNLPVWTAAPEYNSSLPPPNATFPVTRVEMKQAWWKEIFNFASTHPKVKAICSFEYIKSEEQTLRDFTMFGPPGPRYEAGFADNYDVVAAFVEDAKNYPILWAQNKSSTLTTPGGKTNTTTSTSTKGPTTTSSAMKFNALTTYYSVLMLFVILKF